MGNLFDMNGSVYKTLTILYNLIVLNILFVVTSLPLITIGSSITATFSIFNDCKRGEIVISVKDYFHYFRKNCKKSVLLTTIQLCMVLVLGVLIISLSMIGFIQLLLITLLSLTMLVMSWTYGLLAYENQNLQSLLSLSSLIALKLTAYSVVFFLIPIFSFGIVIFLPGLLYPYILFIFSFPLYLQSFILELVTIKLEKEYEWS